MCASLLPVWASFWYNNQGRTLPRFRHNQLAFLEGHTRYRLREGRWAQAAPQTVGPEPDFEDLPPGADPIEEAVREPSRAAALRQAVRGFEAFGQAIS